MQDVSTARCSLDARAFEIRQVLTGEGQDRGRLARLQGDKVSGRGLVTVCWAPEMEVRYGTEVDGGFNRLVRRAVLAKTNGIVGS